MPLADQLGQRIRQLREERGITQENLAYTSDVVRSKSYISEIEAGKKLPSLRVLEGLAQQLEVSLFDLLVFPEEGHRAELVEQTRHLELTRLQALLEELS